MLDLFIANGHVYPEVDKQDWGTTWAERPQLFRNLDGKKFEEVPPATGSGLADVISARGAAFGDIFNDGVIDVVINNIDSKPTLLRNVLNDRQPLAGAETYRRAEEPAGRQWGKSISDNRRSSAARRCV